MRTRTTAGLATALLVAVAVAGCAASTGDQPAAADRPTAMASTQPVRPPALTDFSCAPRSDGSWSAVGTVTNTGYRRADFQVMVAVTAPGDEEVRAVRQRVGLASGDSVKLRFGRVPAPPYRADLTCQARVTRR